MIIKRVSDSYRFRKKWSELGVRFLRSKDFDLSRLRVGGTTVNLAFPEGEESVLEHELGKIFFDDCYFLEQMPSSTSSVLDVGANVGLFSLVARHRFPAAKIHCYEPNPKVQTYLTNNLADLDVQVFPEAVGMHSGVVDLEMRQNSLHSITKQSENGSISMTGLDLAIDRIGGSVDLLKLDCEGAEWPILDEAISLLKVRDLVFEFHLWARPGSTLKDVCALVERHDLRVAKVQQDEGKSWGIMHATRRTFI